MTLMARQPNMVLEEAALMFNMAALLTTLASQQSRNSQVHFDGHVHCQLAWSLATFFEFEITDYG